MSRQSIVRDTASVLFRLQDLAQPVRIERGDGGGRDPGGVGIVLQHPGMRMEVFAEGQRADQHGDRAGPGRGGSSGDALIGGPAVGGERLGQAPVHGPVEEQDLAFGRPAERCGFGDERTSTTGAVRPPAGVPTLPPRAQTPTRQPVSSPEAEDGLGGLAPYPTSDFDRLAWTSRSPNSSMSFRDSSTAAAAPGDPVSRGPTEQSG